MHSDYRLTVKITAWASEHLINRTDLWGGYGSSGPYTAPAKSRRGRELLDRNRLTNHFAGRETVGIHALSRDSTCRWIAFDIDAHDEDADATANWATTERIADVALAAGLEPLGEDSNGRGGYHVWIMFDEPIPGELAYRLALWIKRQAGAPGVEAFPKQPEINAARPCGNWLRIPGKHPRRDHWSRIWNADTERWISWPDAADALIHAPINDAGVAEELRPILPPLRKSEPIPLAVIPDAAEPVCVSDLMRTSIRKQGDRNHGLLSLARYWKASRLPEAVAVARGVAFTRRIPRHLTTSDLSDGEIRANVESVIRAVYTGHYPFDCRYMWTLGTSDQPVACNIGDCQFINPSQRIRTRPVERLGPIVVRVLHHMEVQVV